MQIFSILTFLIILCGFPIKETYAVEFTHFKLKKHPVEQSKTKGLISTKSSKPNFELSPIINDLNALFGKSYINIGQGEVDRLLENYDLGGGVYNFSGFTWHKPMLNYNIWATREVAPELESDQWIVHDQLILQVDAYSFLSNLRDNDTIEIDDLSLNAFIGLSFNRTYHHYHFSKSYLDGLESDFSNLFLVFRKFDAESIDEIKKYEVIKKNDEFRFYAGAVGSTNLGNGVGVGIGFEYATTFKSSSLIQKLGDDEKDHLEQYLRVSLNKEKKTFSQGRASLEYDFFNLLKMTLLSFEFDYEFTKSSTLNLSFTKDNIESIKSDYHKQEELNQMLKGNYNVNDLKEYLISSEQREKENYKSKFSFLLFGNMKRRALEQIRIVTNDMEKIFFKSYSESVTYIQSLLSLIYSKIINRIFQFPTDVSNVSEIRKEFNIEYEFSEDLSADNVESIDRFSMEMKVNFSIDRTDKWYHYLKRKKAISYTRNFTNVDDKIIHMVKSKKLRGPLQGSTHIELGPRSLEYFHHLSQHQLINSLSYVCETNEITSKEFDDLKKELRRNRDLSKKQRCVKNLYGRFEKYLNHFKKHHQYNLKLLKSFLGSYFSKSKNLKALNQLFGSELHVSGSFHAYDKNKRYFQTFYNSGQFDGSGVINQFKLKNK